MRRARRRASRRSSAARRACGSAWACSKLVLGLKVPYAGELTCEGHPGTLDEPVVAAVGDERHVGDAPIGSITYSRRTSGSGRRQTLSAASASTFTRVSLYSCTVPGSTRSLPRVLGLTVVVGVVVDDHRRGLVVDDMGAVGGVAFRAVAA